MFQLGNTLGYYLNDIACADLSGAHFVAVHKKFTMSQPELLVTHTPSMTSTTSSTTTTTTGTTTADPTVLDPRYAFFHNLPDLVPHPHPLEPELVRGYTWVLMIFVMIFMGFIDIGLWFYMMMFVLTIILYYNDVCYYLPLLILLLLYYNYYYYYH